MKKSKFTPCYCTRTCTVFVVWNNYDVFRGLIVLMCKRATPFLGAEITM